MKHLVSTFWRAVLAGVMIAVGGTLYLTIGMPALGSLLFGIGLFSIFSFGLNLFTGKVGYAVANPPSFLGDLALIWLGNLAGTAAVAFALRQTRAGSNLTELAAGVCRAKLSDTLLSLFILAVFCGMLMFFAAEAYKKISDPVGKNIAIFFPVMVFILCGFEHCVANMFYFSMAGVWSADALLRMLVMTAGNAVGAIILSGSRKLLGDL
jgi:formate/nitrite transporter FocA (FNT family)